jgi:hypothetical protein
LGGSTTRVWDSYSDIEEEEEEEEEEETDPPSEREASETVDWEDWLEIGSEGGVMGGVNGQVGGIVWYCSYSNGSGGGVAGRALERVVNRGHRMINSRSSGRVILFVGSISKIRLRMASSSEDKGKIDLRKFWSFK